MSEGVEWALHSCLNLAWVGAEQAVTAAKLAAYYNLPAAYLNKQLQALVRAGIVSSISGPRGGFRLARRPEDISLMDVVVAIEGAEPAFRCNKIMHQGPSGESTDSRDEICVIDSVMRSAELQWRRQLASQTLADIIQAVEGVAPHAPKRTRQWLTTARL
jgi:Rrf2 family protein